VERLQKFMAQAGVASRRKCEELILAGHVRVNGRVERELGSKIDPLTDRIELDGKTLSAEVRHVYLLLYKPQQVISAASDPEGREVVTDLVPREYGRLYPVGRLDWDSEGMVILTNDGALTHLLSHPKHEVSKNYLVKIRGLVKANDPRIDQLRGGVTLDDGEKTQPCDIFFDSDTGKHSWFLVGLREGKNRQIRRMFEAVGLTVTKLKRISYGPIQLGDILPGEFRRLEDEEVEALYKAAGGKRAMFSASRGRLATNRRDGDNMIRKTAERLRESGEEAKGSSRRPMPPRPGAADAENGMVRAGRRPSRSAAPASESARPALRDSRRSADNADRRPVRARRPELGPSDFDAPEIAPARKLRTSDLGAERRIDEQRRDPTERQQRHAARSLSRDRDDHQAAAPTRRPRRDADGDRAATRGGRKPVARGARRPDADAAPRDFDRGTTDWVDDRPTRKRGPPAAAGTGSRSRTGAPSERNSRSADRDSAPSSRTRSSERPAARTARAAGNSDSRSDESRTKPSARPARTGAKPAARSAKPGSKPAARSAKPGSKPAARSAKPTGKPAARNTKPGGKPAARSSKPAGKTADRGSKSGGKSSTRAPARSSGGRAPSARTSKPAQSRKSGGGR